MTDHDDQISNNRRRLFKALSAAPVVMTLRPGAALANASGIQCAANEMPAADIKFYKDASATCSTTTGSGCHAYLQRDYWDPELEGFWLGKFVVQTSADKFFVVYAPSGNLGTVSFTPITPKTALADATKESVVLLGDTMYFFDNNKEKYEAAVGPDKGLFLAVGGPTFDGTVPDGWASDGVWPEKIPTTTNVLGGSCLTSFPTTSGFTLADS